MNDHRIEIKTENTIDSLRDNLNILHVQTKKHEQCTLAIQSLLNYEYEEVGQIVDELTAILQAQSEDILAISVLATNQIANINDN